MKIKAQSINKNELFLNTLKFFVSFDRLGSHSIRNTFYYFYHVCQILYLEYNFVFVTRAADQSILGIVLDSFFLGSIESK